MTLLYSAVFIGVILVLLGGIVAALVLVRGGHRIALHPSVRMDIKRMDTHGVSGSSTVSVSTGETNGDGATDLLSEGVSSVITIAIVRDRSGQQVGHFTAKEQENKLVIDLSLDNYDDSELQSRLRSIENSVVTLLQDGSLQIELDGKFTDLSCFIETQSSGKLRLEYDERGLDQANIMQIKLNIRTLDDRPRVPFTDTIELAKKLVKDD